MEHDSLTRPEPAGPGAARKAFGQIGLALFVIAAITVVLQFAASFGLGLLQMGGVAFGYSSWALWLATFLPLYVVGIPVGLLLMRRVPAGACQQSRLGGGRFWPLLLMCFPVMYVGNIIGTLLAALLSGGAAQNGLMNYALDTNPLKIIVMVVLAPLLEEYVFRKQIIDRCGRYGEKNAMFFSALTFGLFHMNLYQFFYAFGLGLIFAYVYTRTRRLRYSLLMHMIINFMGSVLAPWVLTQVDLEALTQINPNGHADSVFFEVLPGLLLYCGYVVLLLGLSIAGLVLLIIRARKAVFFPAPEELPKGSRIRTVYGNVGTLLFLVFCVAMCALTVLSSLLL